MTNEKMIQQVRELKSLKIMAKELAEEIAKIETSLKEEMEAQGKEHLIVDVFKLNYITVTTHRIDTTALKKDMPAVAEKYMKATTTKRFTVS